MSGPQNSNNKKCCIYRSFSRFLLMEYRWLRYRHDKIGVKKTGIFMINGC